MTWWTEDLADAPGGTARVMTIPVGAASPLWLAFGAAASIGVTWWWMTRWTRAVNLEALVAPSAPTLVSALIEMAPADETPAAVEAVVAADEPDMEPAPLASPEPVLDDLTRLVGVGPKLAQALAARGVTRFSELAAWTAEDLAEIDKALNLKGRAVRDAWVAQAKRLSSAD